MAHYAPNKAKIPYHKREEDRRWKDHLAKHKNNVINSFFISSL